MNPFLRRFLRVIPPTVVALAPSTAPAAVDAASLKTLQTVQDYAVSAVAQGYYPADRFDAAFQRQLEALWAKLPQSRSLPHGLLMIAETFRAWDPAIRLYPLDRKVTPDYGCSWLIVGDAAFVEQLDAECDARRQGVKLGDRLLAVEGTALRRETYPVMAYALGSLAPRESLQLLVQSPGEAPRELTIATRWRSQPPVVGAARRGGATAQVPDRLAEYRDLANQVRRQGQAVVWRASHLTQQGDVSKKVLASARDAAGLIIDLRGLYVFRQDHVMAVLSRLLAKKVEVGRIVGRQGSSLPLRTSGGGKFAGKVFVLTDARTAGYAELLAHMIQQQHRGLVIGDRTFGRVCDEAATGTVLVERPQFRTESQGVLIFDPRNGSVRSHERSELIPVPPELVKMLIPMADLNHDPTGRLEGVRLPVGRLALADGTELHGVGVTPDLLLLPTGADFAGRRDIVLARALAMLGETVTAEAAWRMFRREWDDDETVLDNTALY